MVARLRPVHGNAAGLAIRTQWRGQEVVRYENSRYGNVTVTRREEQYTVYTEFHGNCHITGRAHTGINYDRVIGIVFL